MKICIVITALDFGGAEILLVNSSNILAKNYELHIIYLKGTGKLISELDQSIKVYKIPLNISCFFNLRRLIKKINPDVLHTHVGHADIIGLFATTGLKIKKFCTIHNIRYTWNYIDYIYYFLYSLIFNVFARNCKVIGASNVVAKHIASKLKVNNKNIIILNNAIPSYPLLDKLESRKQLGQKENDFIVLFLGRIEKIKSIDTLIKAIPYIKNKIANLSVEIVGEGTEMEKLKGLSIELGIEDKVTFRGATNTKELFFAAADVFTLPSVSEAMPTVIMESFRAALPVIVSKLESLNEIVSENSNGLMFEVQNSEELSEKIFEIWENKALKSSIGKKGFDTFYEKYIIEAYIKKLTDLYLINKFEKV